MYVTVQFYRWFKFYLILFLGKVMYDNYDEFETKENENETKDKIELQHNYNIPSLPIIKLF